MFWFVLFAGALGASAADMQAKLTLGPFPTVTTCYAAGALGIDDLNRKHPDRAFRGACLPKQPRDLRSVDPNVGLDLGELAERALREND